MRSQRWNPSWRRSQPEGDGHDLAALADAVGQSQAVVAEAETSALRAEAAHSAARQALDLARRPLAEAERRVQRLETEAKTLASFSTSTPRISGRP